MHEQSSSTAPSIHTPQRAEELNAQRAIEEVPASDAQTDEPRDKYDVAFLHCTD